MQGKIGFYKGQIEFNNKISNKVYHTRIKLVEPAEIYFKAGQFANIRVKDQLRRSYSISSSPMVNEAIETFVDVMPQGPGSKFFENAKIGDPVDMLAPLGKFTFVERDNSSAPAVFLATGTGITPFVAIFLEQLELVGNSRPFIFYWGMRYQEDIFLVNELEALQHRFPNFKYKLTLSQPPANWQGLSGYCTELLTNDWNSIADIAQADFYLCGAGKMLEDAEQILLQKNIAKENIFYEKYY